MSGRHLKHRVIDLLSSVFTSGYCQCCGIEVAGRHSLCQLCINRLPRIINPCHVCAEPNPGLGDICAACLLNPPRWQSMFAPFQYRDRVRQFLLQMKYGEATWVANCLCRSVTGTPGTEQALPEVLLPVPLHHNRLLDRGFNQATEIALIWSSIFDIDLDLKALRRVKHTESQSGLDASQRRRNLRQAFSYAPTTPYRHVAIDDDVVTTGATAGEITRLLHQSGVEFVEVWALARTVRRK